MSLKLRSQLDITENQELLIISIKKTKSKKKSSKKNFNIFLLFKRKIYFFVNFLFPLASLNSH